MLMIILVFSAASFSQDRVVAYYPSWMKLRLPADQIKFEFITHVNHAFAWPLADGSITGDAEINHPELIAQTHGAGRKILISLGGFTQSAGFAPMAADSTARKNFVENLVNFCIDNDYDGADIDWEFPQTTADRVNLTILIKEIRAAFDDNDPSLLLTMVAVTSDFNGRWHDYAALAAYVDWFNLMTYDFHGPWFNHAGHNAPLYAPPTDFDGSVDEGVQYLTNTRKIPKEKIHLGLPFYGREFNASALYGPSTGGYDFEYSVIAPRRNAGWVYHWDEVSKVPYLTNPTNTQLASFDDSLSIRLKCEYAKQNRLAGVMIWALGQDLIDTTQPLMEAVGRAMNQPTGIATPKDEVVKTFALLGNYPNPFNAATTIVFQLDRDLPVKLSIYDLTGKVVAILKNANVSKGEHAVIWDATSHASGVYFCKLEAEGGRITARKMILLR
jgi:chitinase